jgi:hypothetical protein
LVRAGNVNAAIEYAKTHLSSASSGNNLKKVEQAMTSILFANNVENLPYKVQTFTTKFIQNEMIKSIHRHKSKQGID